MKNPKETASIISGILGIDFTQRTSSLKLLNFVLNNSTKIYDAILSQFPSLNDDFFSDIWMQYNADRQVKKQDFTPSFMANLAVRMCTNDKQVEGDVLDICSGTGSLSIGFAAFSSQIHVHCIELDEDVIPFLLLNLVIRNISGRVYHANALTGEVYESYTLEKQTKYATVTKDLFPNPIPEHPDYCISNPPFNLKYEGRDANYMFIDMAKKAARAVLILPNGMNTEARNTTQREKLVKDGLVECVCSMPGSTFMNTGVLTSIWLLSHGNDNTLLIDASSLAEKYILRRQGEAHNSARVYTKELNIIPPEKIDTILHLIKNKATTQISTLCTIEQMEAHGFSFSQANYREFSIDDDYTFHRDYNDIIRDINKIAQLKNSLNVTINNTWAKELGLDVVLDLSEKDKHIVEDINSFLESIGITERLTPPCYFSKTASKELKITQREKSFLSPVLSSFFPYWKQHIMTCNILENKLYEELRNALLPGLMSGRIEINDVDTGKK